MQRKIVLATLPLFLIALFSIYQWEKSWATKLFQGLPLLGDPKAKVELVLLEDPLCPHCRALQREVFPEIHDKYIATGKVKVRLALVSYVNGSKPFCLAYYCLAEKNPEILPKYIDQLYKDVPTEVSRITDKFKVSKGLEECMRAAQPRLDEIESGSERLLGENDVVPTAFVNGKRVALPVRMHLITAIEEAL